MWFPKPFILLSIWAIVQRAFYFPCPLQHWQSHQDGLAENQACLAWDCQKPLVTPCPELGTGEWEMPVTLQSSSLLRSFSRHHLISNQRSQQQDTHVVSIRLLPQLFILYPWNVLQPAPRAVPSPAAVLPPSTADLPGSRGGQAAPQLVCRRMWNQGHPALGQSFCFQTGKS